MKYFTDVKTIEELKKQYRSWAMKLHPDHGGSNEEMKMLNVEYEKMFDKVKDIHVNKKGEEYRKETKEKPWGFIKLIDELLKLNGIKIEVIGSFVWVSGKTKQHRKELKGLGMIWHRKKECWYKAPEGYRKFGRKEYCMNDIRAMYGVEYEEEVNHRELHA